MAFNHAFFKRGWLKISALTSVIEPLKEFIKSKSVEQASFDWILAVYQIVGSLALITASFMIAYMCLASVYSLTRRRSGDIGDVFADFWRGGHEAIDQRTKELSAALRNTLTELRDTHEAYNRTTRVVRLYPVVQNEKKLIEFLMVLLEISLKQMWPGATNMRCAIFLHEKDPAKANLLSLVCSVHPLHGTPDHLNQDWPIGSSVAGRCFSTGEVLEYPGNAAKRFYKNSSNKGSFAKSFTCFRIAINKEVWGVLSLDSSEKKFPPLSNGQTLFIRFILAQIAECLDKNHGCGKWKSVTIK